MTGHVQKGRILVRENAVASKFVTPNQVSGVVVVGAEQIKDGDTVVYMKEPPPKSRLRVPIRLKIHDEYLLLMREDDILYIE